MAIKSSLATSDIQAAKGNYSVGRGGKKVGKITIHHAVIEKASAKTIANVFTKSSRKASANYCVGYKRGDICCSLYEENRAWTSSNAENDKVAITMEVANSSVKYPYPVSDDTLANIIDLCVDICKRYNFRLKWTGDKKGTLTVHRMFAKTACPGDYLMEKMPYIEKEVNKRLDEGKETKEEPKKEEPKKEKTSFLPARGWFKLGDKHENVGKIASFMYKTFPAYTKKEALGNYYGKNIQASIKEFQKRTKLEADGCVGPITLKELEKYGFKY